MSFTASLSSRTIRAAVLLIAGWLTLEVVLAQLIAARLGWGLTVLLLSIKGGIGLLLVGAMALAGLRRIGRGKGVAKSIDVSFSLASAILITLPGIVPSLFGIALFSPTLRAALLRRFRGSAGPPERDIDLHPQDWRELRTRRIAKRTKARVKADRTDALEGKRPSV